MTLIELFKICNNGRDYITVTPKNKKYEVDYKFLEDADARTLYIFFEPSDGKTDWVVNFSYWRKPYDDMEIGYRVHGGFLESWKLIRDAVCAKIKEQEGESTEYKWRKVIIVGYSHGGALAALCHECVWFERPDLRDSSESLRGYSFDGPRVYAGLWIKKKLKARWSNFITFRNSNDIVTHLPPVIFFFRHVGELVKIGAKRRNKVAVLRDWIVCKKNQDKTGAQHYFQEMMGIIPHYPNEIIGALEEYENGRN